MAKRNVNDTEVIKKGEAATILGFGITAGYKYLDYLCKHELLLPIALPGLKTPRYLKQEVLEILKNRNPIKGIPAFQANIQNN